MFGQRSSLIVIALTVISFSVEFSHFDPNRRPKLMGDSLPLRAISPKRARVQNKIVLYHNFFRSRVEPKASNMLKMKWHKGAAKAAQKWAEKCQFLVHDTTVGRHVREYGTCGQNIFIASTKVPWLFAIETWWLEKNDFVYGEKNNMTLVGHYTQLVWASSHEVGCGLSKCRHKVHYQKGNQTEEKERDFYNYVCNYCPIGNRPGKTSHPYKLGNPCSSCKKHCSKTLCLNSCNVADTWANCGDLHRNNPIWLCRANGQKEKKRVEFCKATCTCANKIYD